MQGKSCVFPWLREAPGTPRLWFALGSRGDMLYQVLFTPVNPARKQKCGILNRSHLPPQVFWKLNAGFTACLIF